MSRSEDTKLISIHEMYGQGVMVGLGLTPSVARTVACGRTAALEQYARGIRDGKDLSHARAWTES